MRKLESNISVDNEPFQDIVRYENESLHNSSITNSNIGSPLFFNCTLQGLTFENCDLNNTKFFADCTIEACTFIRCDLRAVGIADNEAVFTNCEFISCDMRGMTLENATFIHCSFLKCKFNDRTLQAARMVNCTFTGKLVDITFEGKGQQLLQVNLEQCTLNGVEFIGCDLSECTPPKTKHHLYVDDMSKRAQQAVLHRDHEVTLSEDEQKMLVRRLRKLEQAKQYIFNIADMKKQYGESFVQAFFKCLNLDVTT